MDADAWELAQIPERAPLPRKSITVGTRKDGAVPVVVSTFSCWPALFKSSSMYEVECGEEQRARGENVCLSLLNSGVLAQVSGINLLR